MQQDYFTTYIIEKLRDARIQAHLSVEDVAERVGVHPETVRYWENTPAPYLTMRNIVEYAHACGITPLDFLVTEKRRFGGLEEIREVAAIRVNLDEF